MLHGGGKGGVQKLYKSNPAGVRSGQEINYILLGQYINFLSRDIVG